MDRIENVITVIPARGGSRGIPGKNLVPLCGRALLAWSIDQARATRHASEVYVSTDDADIARVAREAGAQVIDRPEELATDTASSEAALLHALDEVERARPVDWIVFLQATSPVREAADIDAALEAAVAGGYESLFSAARLEDWLLWSLSGEALAPVNYDPQDRGRRQDRAPMVLENGSIYVVRADTLRAEKNRLGGRTGLYEMPLWKSFEIDSPEDVALCEVFLRRMLDHRALALPAWDQVDLVVYDFDGVLTDNRVLVDERGVEAVRVNRSDGLAMDRIRAQGIAQLILSTERNPVVAARARKLRLPTLQGVDDKAAALERYCARNEKDPARVVYFGNDVNDLAAMRLAGWAVCPADAAEEVRAEADLVLCACGGAGVVREWLGRMGAGPAARPS